LIKKIRTGIGYDIHRLDEGRRLVLGGVEIPFSRGLVGHSDGDVLIHAVIDALLGAMGEKDIGQCFPDTNPAYRDIQSTELLVSVAIQLKQGDYEVCNIDSIVVAEEPKLAPFIPAMKDILCPILGLPVKDLGIKAKTREGLGDVGDGRAIAAWAVATISSRC
jgi:2-C-methyl-D-erythritol 2,4-cyclodiphosphate synthase